MPDEQWIKNNLDEALDQIDQLTEENRRLVEAQKQLEDKVAELSRIIRRAKNASPVERPSLQRIIAFCQEAFIEIRKAHWGWELSLGSKRKRVFRSLKEIWEIFVEGDWTLSELLPIPKPAPILKFKVKALKLTKPILRFGEPKPRSFGGGDVTFADGFP